MFWVTFPFMLDGRVLRVVLVALFSQLWEERENTDTQRWVRAWNGHIPKRNTSRSVLLQPCQASGL